MTRRRFKRKQQHSFKIQKAPSAIIAGETSTGGY